MRKKDKRQKTYSDILLEVGHVFKDGSKILGWMEKELFIDYLAYAFVPIRTAYLFPWLLLKKAWKNNKSIWRRTYGMRSSRNKNYISYSIPVPIGVLLEALKENISFTQSK